MKECVIAWIIPAACWAIATMLWTAAIWMIIAAVIEIIKSAKGLRDSFLLVVALSKSESRNVVLEGTIKEMLRSGAKRPRGE